MTKLAKKESVNRVQVLAQALPYIQKFYGKTFVIKYGGAAMENPLLKAETIRDFVLLSYVGIKLVIVHGGGPEINTMLNRLKLPVKFKNGNRVTDAKTMEVVEMVLVGKVQKELVNLINLSDARAVGLCGKDGKLFVAKRSPGFKNYGQVGEIESVDTSIIHTLLDSAYIPVVSSVGADQKGNSFNINADNVAYTIALALKASKLILMTDTPGILSEPANPRSLLSKLTINETQKLILKKVITDGMIPKAQSAIKALRGGVNAVHIIDGRQKHSILLEIFTDSGIGTMIVK